MSALKEGGGVGEGFALAAAEQTVRRRQEKDWFLILQLGTYQIQGEMCLGREKCEMVVMTWLKMTMMMMMRRRRRRRGG